MNSELSVNNGVLDSKKIKLTKDSFCRCTLHYDQNEHYNDVSFRRAFPLTSKSRCVCIYDMLQNEIGIIDDIEVLDSQSKEIILKELELVYFSIVVIAINSVKSRYGVSTWNLQTENGARTIHVKDRSDIRKVDDRHIMITDNEGMRYMVDIGKVDQKSVLLIEAEA